jgi:hypothetical protein
MNKHRRAERRSKRALDVLSSLLVVLSAAPEAFHQRRFIFDRPKETPDNHNILDKDNDNNNRL